MHEVSMAQALVQTVERSARDAGLERVTAMNVELGPHAGVAPGALAFALQLAAEGTVAEGAAVEFSGQGAEPGAAHDHEPEHARAHAPHSHEHDLDNPAAALDGWTVRLAWIEGT